MAGAETLYNWVDNDYRFAQFFRFNFFLASNGDVSVNDNNV